MTEIKVFLVEVDGCGWGKKRGRPILLGGGSLEWRQEWGGQVRLKREKFKVGYGGWRCGWECKTDVRD